MHTTLLNDDAADVSHLHTTLLHHEDVTDLHTTRLPVPPQAPPDLPRMQRLQRPERTQYLSRLKRPPLVLPEAPESPPSTEAPEPPRQPEMHSTREAEAAAQAHAQREAHAAEAHRWRVQADEVSELIRHDTERFSAITARWRTLVRSTQRSLQDDMELARLEVEVPHLSQRLARARKRWTECLAHARQYEGRATQPYLPNP